MEIPAGQDVELHGEVIVLGVRRCPDGRAVFAMSHKRDDTTSYALIVSAENTMRLLGFLANQPAGAAS